jgi:hypothetical protein
MRQGCGQLVGFGVIVILYATIGALAVAGAVVMTRRFLAPRAEQVFYGLVLIVIAAMYLAFAAYFEAAAAWRVEIMAVLAFAVLGLLGTRVPAALIVGYPLHGAWDALHELQAHGAHTSFEPGHLTLVPLAYGVFCAVFDIGIAAYFVRRRTDWGAARKS